jgi:hypothetical protein
MAGDRWQRRSKFAGHDDMRRILQSMQQPSEESLDGSCVAAHLNQVIEHDTV